MRKRAWPYLLILAASYLFALVISWTRWGDPLVDCGREMMQPLRLLQGEMLYSNIRHIYGPFSPYLNAFLYRVFGVSLKTLYAEGAATGILVIVLVYWLSRQIMSRAAAVLATLLVQWLCVFHAIADVNAAGDYFLPYCYSALHGSALGLVTLCLLVCFLRTTFDRGNGSAAIRDSSAGRSSGVLLGMTDRKQNLYLLAAGVAAGLAALAKTEMGFAAGVAGVFAASMAGYPSFRRCCTFFALFAIPAVTLIAGGYGVIAASVGWPTLIKDSYLFFTNVPSELLYFNRRISGFDYPAKSLMAMLTSTAEITLAGAVIGIVAYATVWLRPRPKIQDHGGEISALVGEKDASVFQRLAIVLITSALVLAVVAFVGGAISLKRNPLQSLPIAIGVVVLEALRHHLKKPGLKVFDSSTAIRLLVAVYAFASLLRILLRIRTGGAYGPFLVPSSIILLTYATTCVYVDWFKNNKVRAVVRALVYATFIVSVITITVVGIVHYRIQNSYKLQTRRGTMFSELGRGEAFAEAIKFIEYETSPGTPIAILPEGTALIFFTGRRNPLREEIITPGFLDDKGETRTIQQLQASNTRLILIANRPNREFGVYRAGLSEHLMRWIEQHFEPVATFGAHNDSTLQYGARPFFIRAYRKRGR